jgi:hypothetical protein
MNHIKLWMMSPVKILRRLLKLIYRGGFGIYKYLLEAMKYLLKTDTGMILEKDFVVQKYTGFLVNTQQNDEFRPVEVSEKDRFMTQIMKSRNSVSYSDKYKDLFMPFLIKNFNITCYNLICIPIHDEVYGPIGVLIFGNKQIKKDPKYFDKTDEQLGEICGNLIRTFF